MDPDEASQESAIRGEDDTADEHFDEQSASKEVKKRGRKPVAKRKKVKRTKESGKYRPRRIAETDADIVDCIFSDDEVKEAFCDSMDVRPYSELTSDSSEASSVSDLSSMQSPGIVPVASKCESDASVTSDSRPSSSASTSRPPSTPRTASSLSSRPSSALDVASPSTAEEVTQENTSASTLATCNVLPPADRSAPVDSSQVQLEEGQLPSVEVISASLEKFRSDLPSPWVPVADQCGFHLLLLSAKSPKAIQREIFISYHGNVIVLMHCVPVPNFKTIFKESLESVVLHSDISVENYCEYGVKLVKHFMQYEVCVGADDMETRKVWYMIANTFIDCNPYRESKYGETCRSLNCHRIIKLGHGKRCVACSQILKHIKQRKEFLLSPEADPNTSNRNLTPEQSLRKLEYQHESIRKKDKRIAWLEKRVESLLENQGVNIDEDLGKALFAVMLESSSLTEVQKMFLTQQMACMSTEDARGYRWHPTMIRIALHLHSISNSAYQALRDIGIIQLPSVRTLFDYSHAIKAKEGINEKIVELAHKNMKEHSVDAPHKEFHVLLCDGMHVSQNLVFRRGHGDLVGYASMDDMELEMERFDKYVAGKEAIPNEPELATEVLAYMIKGISTDVKYVVACYPYKSLTKEMLYVRTWDVIGFLEKSGLKILAFVCDGFPVNRAFFAMHTPLSKDTHFGVVFDTLNFCSPDERPLFFISDVCHLLKTLRNSIYNSGAGPKKPRLLTLNDEEILWKFIVRLFLTYKNDTFRKSYKLNAQNVFPNSYSRMKVRYAAQVLSKTVAQDLEDQKWPATAETVELLRKCNRFFDILNGAHSSQAVKSRNTDLAPYTKDNVNDARFEWLKGEFLEYLVEWRKQVYRKPLPSKEKEKMFLPMATAEGIEISIRGIEAATKFYLDPNKGKGDFLMARCFSQDPLEQNFGRQRAGGGGSRNPNVSQFLSKQVTMSIERDLGVKRRRGNVTDEGSTVTVSTEPLPKRPKRGKK